MRLRLMESERKRERHGSGIASSVVVHAAVIGLVLYGTASAKAVVHRDTPAIIPTFPVPTKPATPTSGHVARPRCELCTPMPILKEVLPAPNLDPTVVVPPVSWDSLVGAPNDWGSGHGAASGPGSPERGSGGAFRSVDVVAVPDARNPAPVYPTMLRDAGIEGSISAQFVVDSTGRVAASSITFLDGGNALFQQSVRLALEAARFSPALVNGHPVRVLMAQTFEFRLRR